MTIRQLIRALEVIPGRFQDCPVSLAVDGQDVSPEVVSLHVFEAGDTPRAVALVRNRGGEPEGFPAPMLIVMPGTIVS